MEHEYAAGQNSAYFGLAARPCHGSKFDLDLNSLSIAAPSKEHHLYAQMLYLLLSLGTSHAGRSVRYDAAYTTSKPNFLADVPWPDHHLAGHPSIRTPISMPTLTPSPGQWVSR
jgi:hypothetical protein